MIGAPRTERVRHAPWIGFVALATAAGIFLRAWQLGSQLLVDDEWHAIAKLLASDYRDIATHFGFADYCIPFTLYFKFLAQHDSLTEWAMRWPVLACGVILIPLAPWLMRRQTGATTLALWSGLIAISPLMVYHSHVVRPYAITTPLVFAALIALFRWWTESEHRLRRAIIYVVCAAAAAWLHLITLPFLLMPFVYFGIAALVPLIRRRTPFDGRRFAGLFVIGIVTALALVALLLPPFLGDWLSITAKAATGYVDLETVSRMVLIFYGTGSWIVGAFVTVLLALGVAAWWRRDAFFVGYIATICLAAAFAIGASRPAWIQHQLAFARYLQPAVPFVLLFIAEGAALAIAALSTLPRVAASAATIAALYLLGPIPAYLYDPNQFMANPYFQFDYDPGHNKLRTEWPVAPVTDFYLKLAAQPPRSLTLIEAPWSMLSYAEPEPFYQMADRQLRRGGFVGSICGKWQYGEFGEDSGIHLRHFVHVEALLRGEHNGDFLVMHRKAWPKPMSQWPDVAACLPAIQARLGPPAYDDGDIAVFALTDKARAIAPGLR